MSNFKVTSSRTIGEADTREEARELAVSALATDPDCDVVTIHEATGASADEKLTRDEADSAAEPEKERKAPKDSKEPTRKK